MRNRPEPHGFYVSLVSGVLLLLSASHSANAEAQRTGQTLCISWRMTSGMATYIA